MRYELVLLDADGTLFNYDKAESYALEGAFARFDLAYDEGFHLPAYKAINEQLWRDYEDEKITSAALRVERFRRLFTGQGLRFDFEEFSRVYLHFLSMGSFLLDGAEEACRYLAQKYRLAIITNGIREVQMARFSSSPLVPFIERVIVSEDAGYSKPHPGIFDYAFRALGHSDKETALIVGDSLSSDIEGGIRFGIKTCWYNPHRKPTHQETRPDYEITDLRELAEFL